MFSASRSFFLIFLLFIITFNFILTDDQVVTVTVNDVNNDVNVNHNSSYSHLVNQTYELINSLSKYLEEFRIEVASQDLNSSITIPLLLPVGTTNLFGRIINMFHDLRNSEKSKRYATMDKEINATLVKNIVSYFNFIRELDDEECLAKMICEIGADPFEYGAYGKGMDKFFFSLNSTPIDNVNVKYYLEVYNLGNEEGYESCQFIPCDQNMTKIAKYFNTIHFDRLMTGSPDIVNMDELNEIIDAENESHPKTERDIFSSGWKRLTSWIGLGTETTESDVNGKKR